MVELLAGGLDPVRLGDDDLAAPHLLDTEVLSALRALAFRGALDPPGADAAVAGFLALEITRFPADPLRPRIWELRHSLTAYDATYVALAEDVDAAALLTTDARMARAHGPRCPITVL